MYFYLPFSVFSGAPHGKPGTLSLESLLLISIFNKHLFSKDSKLVQTSVIEASLERVEWRGTSDGHQQTRTV